MLFVHGGNRPDGADRATPRFPAARVGAVTEQVDQVLRALAPTAVVSAPAAGADLVVLASAQRLGIPVHVVVPIARDRFERSSIVDAGAEWVGQFEQVLAAAAADPASSITHLDLDDGGEWYVEANGDLLAEAARRAGPDEKVVAFTIRPLDGEEPPSVSDDLADRAAAAGLVVLTLDPRPPPDGSAAGVHLACTVAYTRPNVR